MQISIEDVNALERKMTVGIPASEIESSVSKKLNETSKTIRLDGFRPGKVPAKVVKKRFGPAIRGEVVEKLIQDHFFKAITEKDIKPAGMPSIESVNDEEGKDLEFVAKFEVFPEINVAGFDAIEINTYEAEITDADFEERLTQTQENAKEWKDVERAAKSGDQLTIDFEGTKDGELFEGGAATDSPLELGSNSMIPGFEDGLVGAKLNEEKSLDLTFPDDYQAEELQGQKVNFKVTVKAVKESVMPELDDAFAEKMGVTEGGVEALKTKIRESMDKELDGQLKGKIKQQVMEALVKNNPIEVPKSVVSQQIDALKHQMLGQFGGGANFDTSIFPDEMFEEKAKENAALSLVLSKIIETRELSANREDVKKFVEDMAESYAEQKDEVIQFYMNDPQRTSEIEAVVLEQMLVDLVLKEGKVTHSTVSFKEAITPLEPAAPEEGAEAEA